MEKSLLVFILIVVGILYGVQFFVGNIEDEYMPESIGFHKEYTQYFKEDSVGQVILVFDKNVPLQTQLDTWTNSPLRGEFISYFPAYNEMEDFVKDRTNGRLLKQYLLERIAEVKSNFFQGKLDTAQARQMLSSIQ